MKYDYSDAPSSTPVADAAGAEDVFVAQTSFAQQRFWFLRTMEPDSAAYNIYAAVRAEGRLDVAVLERSLNEVVRRHESLRTTFATLDERAVQVIASTLRLKVERFDLRSLPDREEEALRIALGESRRPLDLSRGPLLRLILLALADEEHLMLLVLDHIIGDSWSVGVLIREVCALYDAFSSGRPSPLPELEIQYIDYAEWQRERLQSEVLERQLEYWKRQLGGAQPVLELPTDFTRPARQAFNGAHATFEVPRELRAKLEATGRRHGATLFMTLLAAFQTLLQRYTGQGDILIGTPIAGRTQSETEGLIGCFVNTLVLRSDLSADPRFTELLAAVREMTLEAHTHQDVPFEILVETLQPARNLSHTPLFQVMFGLQPSVHEIKLHGLTVKQVALANDTAKFDLMLDIREFEDGLFASFEYNTDLFHDSTVRRMAGHFTQLLEAVVGNPDLHLSELPLLTAAERRQLLVEWNDTTVHYPRHSSIHELFEQQAQRTPDALALVFGHERIGYQELNARANRLAHHLRSLGVGAEVLVGLCLERSVEMVVGLLAILKAGGAYVPLDPSYPLNRLSFMMEDARAPLLLTEKRLLDALPEGWRQVVLVDEEAGRIAQHSVENPASGVSGENLAYVIYTSGSTGRPKGVAIEHRSTVALLHWARDSFSPEELDGVLASTSISFDLSVFELFVPLSWGGKVILAENALSLPELPNASEVRLINTVPSAMTELVRMGKVPSSVRTVNLAGEALPRALVESIHQQKTIERVLNLYGPSEDTTYSTFTVVAGGGEKPPSIGRPVANTEAYLLDRHFQLVPVGVTGELYLAGHGLARGYLFAPHLTAERFVPHPFGSRPGSRLYRTGDLARYMPDGQIEFLGRADHQVKVRGFRIELGEVEAALAETEGVRECAVVAREDEAGGKRLVGYVVGDGELSAAELRRVLKERLPEYMVPSEFMQLVEMPLTANGKIDRRALPAPEGEHRAAGRSSVAPRTPVEQVLAGIWSDVLGVNGVGVYDDFFELGGHSLLAMQMVSRVRDVFGVEVSLRRMFEEPTLAGVAAGVEVVLRKGEDADAPPPLARVSREGELPLSFAQARLWFLNQLEPENSFYNIHAAIRLTGEFDAGAFNYSLSEIIRRHESLRTEFRAIGGRPVQVIADFVELNAEVEDLSALPEPERTERVRQLALEEAETPFDLTRAPLLRMKILRLGETDHVVLLTMHHIISDGWSTGVLIREMGTHYKARISGSPSTLAELPVQYADFAVWQRQWLEGGALEKQLAYWKRQLADNAPALELPTDRPRPAVQTYRGAAESFGVSSTLADQLKALSRSEGATLYMTLLAAFQTLLYRYTGQSDIAVGTPIANRNRAETEGLIGFFVNTLVLRSKLNGAGSFSELLRQVRDVTLGAYAHQDVPFDRLVEELQPVRDMSRSPLFQVVLAFQNAPQASPDEAGLKMSRVDAEHRTAKFDLMLEVDDSEPELRCLFEYNTDLFDAATIRRMAACFETLLQGIVNAPASRKLSELPLLDEEAERQLLAAHVEAHARFPQDKCLHQLFAEQAARTPDALALTCDGASMTYGDLDRRSNRIARYLRGREVGTEARVGLMMARSLDLVVSLLGILKAGAAYVPLDPAYPQERLRFMAEDAALRLVLTRSDQATALGDSSELISIDERAAEINSLDDGHLDNGSVTPANLAYVIYTSGSTGRPKGVAVTHANVARLFAAARGCYDFGAEDVWTLFHSPAFDFSVWELWGALLYGGRLVVVPYLVSRSPTEFLALLGSEGVTILNQTPSAFRQLSAAREGERAAGGEQKLALREVIFGGEGLDLQSLRGWFARHGETQPRLVNMYGITETTVHVTFRSLLASDLDLGVGSVIGEGLSDLRVYVLDGSMRLLPVGVAGELYVGGAGLARGYLNQPALTAERFVPDPYAAEAGARLYRTGDVARRTNGGELEYLGRMDAQVKVRGHRIELGEVEAALSNYEAVRECAVVAREETPGDNRLVAYIVAAAARDEAQPTATELRAHLKERLPEYMVPSAFVVLDALPLTPNGKVDRRALIAREATPFVSPEGYAAPRTPTEELLADIWAEVIGLNRVGIHDNFFDLGGHSLLTTQIVSRVRDGLGVVLPLRAIFESPTVAELSTKIEAAAQQEQSPAVPIAPAPRDGQIPLSFAQQRLWFIHQLETMDAAYHMPFAFRARGRLRADILEQTLNEVVRRHEVLRTTFSTVNGEPVQTIAPFTHTPLVSDDLSGMPEGEREQEARRLTAGEARRPFDLERGPLFRARLISLNTEEHLLTLTLHHIIADGWSLGVLVREVKALYEALSEGMPSPLAELPIQYADFAVWQREWLRGDVLENQLAYWRAQLEGVPAALELPTDHPRPPALSFRGAQIHFELPRELNDALKQLSRSEGATLFMTLLAVFQTLLYRYTGQADIAVGTPIANRQRREIEGLIGFFVNTLTLRVDLSGTPRFTEIVRRVREVTLGAYAHQDVPFEKLVEELHLDRDLSRNPLFQVMFALQNAPVGNLELPGLTLNLQEADSDAARFDMEWHLWEQDETLKGILVYSTELFAEATVRRMLSHFERLLETVVRMPDERITALPLLAEAEEHQLLGDWQQTGADFARTKRVHELFTEQAARTPDAGAVVFGGRSLTYRELDARSNQLGRRLRRDGVGADDVVGICAERSIEMIVALLAVLKAGGAYLPLDPEYPQERLALMLEDAGARVLLTHSRLAERLPRGRQVEQLIQLDADWDEVARESVEGFACPALPENLAYVIYTSGSTGRPKAIAMPHRPLVNLITYQLSRTRAGARPRTLQFASLSFDVSFQETLSTLCAGAPLVLIGEEARRDSSELLRVLCAERIERLFLPFVALHYLAETMEPEGVLPSSLREVNTAGEQLKITRAVRSMFASLPGCVLDNHYGPSESHLVSTFRLEGDTDVWPQLPPIGRPISNTQLYVLDSQMRAVPVGVTGELHIGGECLSRGYLNRPGATAGKFVPHPFAGELGARLYKTGDRARFLSDGNLEFIGRVDQQLKVRGFRVEPGEIEAALREHAAVREAIVTARENGNGEKRLVAYLLAEPGNNAATAELRGYLRERLPEYMVPSSLILLDEFPLTPSGKVDTRALPAPDGANAEAGHTHVAPRTPTEELLAGLWAGVLGISRVGADDNFFESGGHSLLATQLMSRVREAFRVELPLRRLFEMPTLAALASCIDGELRAAHVLDEPPLVPGARAGAQPASFAQQRLWFLHQLDPESHSYNIPAAVRLNGHLDLSALERSLQEIVRRHEALRTTFGMVDGQPVQIITPHAPSALDMRDLTAYPEDEREAEALRLVREEAQAPFDLSVAPLVRMRLLKLTDSEHVLLLTMHHVVSDGWSMGVLVREMATLYEAFAKGEDSPLSEFPIQYADFAAWQRNRLRGDLLEQQLSYWRENLNGAPPLLELPIDRPRPSVQTSRGATVPIELPRELNDALNELGRREGVTLFMTLLAVFQTLLHRYTGQADIVVGSPIAGRTRAELESLIGFFVNTLVLRTDISGDPDFPTLLRRVRQMTLGAYQHQDVPFEKLVDEFQPARDPSHTPLFQVMFALQNVAQGLVKLDGLDINFIQTGDDTAKFDLTVVMTERDGVIGGSLVYNTDLFDADTARRMAGHFQNLLAEIAERPQQRLSTLLMLTPEERGQLLVEWNDTATPYPADQTIHELFEAEAAHAPDAVALIHGSEQFTYRELNSRANQLAHHLLARGVVPDVPVVVCLERSVEMIVGLLAILKAGGAYVPLDPAYPQERLTFILEDTRAGVMLSERSLASRAGEWQGRVVLVDEEAELIAAHSTGNPHATATRDSLAYVIYTSGSTGTPKGVATTHRGVVRLVRGSAFASFSPAEVFLQLAPVSFDASTFEVWGALLNGASLVVMPPHVPSLEELAAAIRDYRVTTLWLTAGLFHLMVDEQPEALGGLRQLLAGGDVLSAPHVTKALAHLGTGARLVNGYGPTEGTTFACCHVMHAGETFAAGVSVPIGRPIANTTVYLLDAWLNPVAVGVTGQLYIGGDGLARGYLGRPGLTAERFIPHPYAETAGERLYATGDLARQRPGGHIEFMGRIDTQVKVRGFRVELGEVEAILAEAEGVRECVVVAQEDEAGGKRLVGYVVGDGELSAAELRRVLKERLPEYMVPSEFMQLLEMPLTANGKVDRCALPAPDGTRSGTDTEYVAPRTPTEEVLAGIWAGVLGVERVGIKDNFFELGGHSMQAVQLVSRLRAAFGADISLRVLLLSPNVAELARRIESALQSGDNLEAPPIERVPRDGALQLSFAQQRLWFLHQLDPESAAYNIPEAIRLRGTLDTIALERSLQEIVRRHEVLRTTFSMHEGRPVQHVNAAQDLSLPFLNLSDLEPARREEQVRRIAEEERLRPFDLGSGPVVRAHCLKLAGDEHVLLVVMHHIVADGWSMGVLIRELSTLYRAFASGEPSPLPELEIQYADYAHWQRSWLQGELLEQHLAYWRGKLAGVPPLLELPADRPRPPLPSYRGARYAFALPAALSAAVKELSRSEGTTPFMTLLAAFQTLLHRYTKREDIVVGADVNNRRHLETEKLIGFFINMLVMRTDISGDPTFGELLGRMREVAIGAYAHQDTPFEKIVEELQPERHPGHSPIFQVVFNFVNAPEEELKLPGLMLSQQAFDLGEVRFDLSLFMWDRADELSGMWTYSTDLFDAARIERMHRHFETLLESIVAQPGARVSALEYQTAAEKADQSAAKVELKKANLSKFKRVRPQAVTHSLSSMVRTSSLQPGALLPLVFEPEAGMLDLANWAESNRELVRARLLEHGAILFRGFGVRTAREFGELTHALSPHLLDYAEPSSQRTDLGNRIYTSTEYPSEQFILLHNELSYAHDWPQMIYFCCLRPAETGGETPLASSRRVYELLDPAVRERFEQRRVMYVRNFGDGLGLTWQHVFGTTDRARVEDYCRQSDIEFEWKAGGERLKTRQVRQAVARHPRTGEIVWFNQAHLFHSAGLDGAVRHSLRALFRDEDLPSNAFYGDGSPIEDTVIAEIRRAYAEATVKFPWQAGDVLMLDNMLAAHGRAPFTGAREVMVAMAEPFDSRQATPVAEEAS
jgi:amino acid adenylation domain-containing protein